jgi:hypothetical protein
MKIEEGYEGYEGIGKKKEIAKWISIENLNDFRLAAEFRSSVSLPLNSIG